MGISTLNNWFSLGADPAWAENRTPYGPYFLWLARAVVGLTGAQPDASVLLFRLLAYRLQAQRLGDLDGETRRLLDHAPTPEAAGRNAVRASTAVASVRAGTILTREWNGQMHRVSVLAEGFAWNGKTYPSLSNVAFAITGTRWNGPRFFGLRDRSTRSEANP